MPPRFSLSPVSLVMEDSPPYLMINQEEILWVKLVQTKRKIQKTPLTLSLGKRLLGNLRIIFPNALSFLKRHLDLLVTVLNQTLILNLGNFLKFLPTPVNDLPL